MAYQKELADDRGNLYPRKDQYIIDKIAGKNPDKNSHPYIKKLSQYEKKEKELLEKTRNYMEVITKARFDANIYYPSDKIL